MKDEIASRLALNLLTNGSLQRMSIILLLRMLNSTLIPRNYFDRSWKNKMKYDWMSLDEYWKHIVTLFTNSIPCFILLNLVLTG